MIELDWGLFWFDDTPGRTLAEKIDNATTRYRIKYNLEPTLCYVHPSVASDVETVKGIRVVGLKTVQPNHFWLGVAIEKKHGEKPKKPVDEQITEVVVTAVEHMSTVVNTCEQ